MLFRSLFPQVILPREVVEELLLIPHADTPALQRQLSAFHRLDIPCQPERRLLADLDLGEAAVIATAVKRQITGILMDEKRGRRIATLVYGLQVKGTCAVLVAAKNRGLISAVRPLLETMRARGYYLGPQVVTEALRLARE